MKYRLGQPGNYRFSSSSKTFSGSQYLKTFDFILKTEALVCARFTYITLTTWIHNWQWFCLQTCRYIIGMLWSFKQRLFVIKINNLCGDLTDVAAETESLIASAACILRPSRMSIFPGLPVCCSFLARSFLLYNLSTSVPLFYPTHLEGHQWSF